MGAAERWAADLAAWAIPEEILAAADQSPYVWDRDLIRRMRPAPGSEAGPTTTRIGEALGPDGSLLDVGAGAGRLSMSFAEAGHRVTAVEPDRGMAHALEQESATRGVTVALVTDRWPAPAVDPHTVAVSGHVVYDVAEIGPFLVGLHEAARRRVVIECTTEHPRAHLNPLFEVLHGIGRPSAPTDGDLVDVVAEVVGVIPNRERWSRPGSARFADLQELTAFYARQLALPAGRVPELLALVEPHITEADGWLTLAGGERGVATIWWDRA